METTPELEAMCAAFKAELTRQGVIYQPEADWPAPTDLCMSTGERANLAAALRAALLAIRTATFDTAEAGVAPTRGDPNELYAEDARQVFTAMIDHILGQPA